MYPGTFGLSEVRVRKAQRLALLTGKGQKIQSGVFSSLLHKMLARMNHQA